MNLPFRRRLADLGPAPVDPVDGHTMTSDFIMSVCRFVLTCSCGAQYDTPYIDEALEIRELHMMLAPLADQMADRQTTD